MKIKYTLAGLCTAFFIILPLQGEEEETEMGKQMSAMNDAYKAMKRETDPAKGAALAREAQNAMFKAILETPERVKKMPEADQPKACAEYRKMMGELISMLAGLEIAFLDGDLEKVKEIAEAMRANKKKGHDQFMEE